MIADNVEKRRECLKQHSKAKGQYVLALYLGHTPDKEKAVWYTLSAHVHNIRLSILAFIDNS